MSARGKTRGSFSTNITIELSRASFERLRKALCGGGLAPVATMTLQGVDVSPDVVDVPQAAEVTMADGSRIEFDGVIRVDAMGVYCLYFYRKGELTRL